MLAYDDSNIFARILRGEVPARKILENEYVFAFHDAFPKAPVHVLVIPKGRYIDIAHFGRDASPEEITALWRAVTEIARSLDLDKSGFRTIANTGVHGGQEVPHFHVHLIGGKKLGAMIQE